MLTINSQDNTVTVIANAPVRGWSKLTFVKRDRTVREFALDAGNEELMLQVGRALAHMGDWTLADDIALPQSTVKGNRVVKGYVLRHTSGRIVAALIVLNSREHVVAEVYELTRGTWQYHPITHISRNKTYRANHTGQYVVAYTKYHLLAKLLRGDKVFVVGDEDDARDDIQSGFERETYMIARKSELS